MKVALLYGGRSGEHDVSRVSAASIARHMDPSRELLLVGIAPDGRWYLQDPAGVARCRVKGFDGADGLPVAADPAREIAVVPGAGLAVGGESLAVDIAFPIVHGTFGEDGTLQGLLEMAGIPYAGAGVMGSAVGMDKEKTKRVWKEAGLPVVPFELVRAHEWEDASARAEIADFLEKRFGFPCFVKPARAGSSVGAAKAHDAAELLAAIADALVYDAKVLVEPFVEAREVECSVSGNEFPRAYVPGEIVPSHEFYDYDAKYVDPDGAALLIPANLGAERLEEVRAMARGAYAALDLEGFARVDFFLDKKTGEILLNEVNTLPGFTSISMFPKMCEAGGLPYSKLIDHLLELGLERHAKRQTLKFRR